MSANRYVPITPAGTPLADLAAETEDRAWANLLRAAAHMPYKGKKGFQKRGYRIGVMMPKRGAP